MITSNSIKDYYIKLNNLYTNAVNMLTAINQSLTSSSSEVEVIITDTDDAQQTVKLPSFLYLENKVEQLSNIIDNLFEIPDSGEAWFQQSDNMYKLEMVQSNIAPITIEPSNISGVYASYKNNPILKDLVSPKMFLKLDIADLTDNITKLFMKKIVIYNYNLYSALSSMGRLTYAQTKAALYNYESSYDYEEYDNTIDLPLRTELYNAEFEIDEIITDGYVDETDGNTSHLTYELRLDTLQYSNTEDTSITYTLKEGDYLCLGKQLVIYKIKTVDTTETSIVIEELTGHSPLMTYTESSDMMLKFYRPNYNNFHYAEIPVEENQYIMIFIGAIYNNVRGQLSKGYLFNMNEIYMYDANGNKILNSSGKQYTYIDYYNNYCSNIGDMIYALTESSEVQLANYSNSTIQSLVGKTNNISLIQQVQNTLSTSILSVEKINNHITNDDNTQALITLNSQKAQVVQELSTIQSNIDELNNQLNNTDFSQVTSINKETLLSQLTESKANKVEKQKQLTDFVTEINTLSANSDYYLGKNKFRIRGTADIATLEKYVQAITNDTKCKIIGLDVEYKYRGVNKDTDTLETINGDIYTPWNKLQNIEREKVLTFTSTNYSIDYKDYDTTDLGIKWNQIDIPIQQGEDVVLRYRYKYNIGQPFINIYTPWSDDDDENTELTIVFPDKYKDQDSSISTILETNSTDNITSTINTTLINDGYEDHIDDVVKTGDVTFYHKAENIYSGFTTPENNLISLKDKLESIDSVITDFQDDIKREKNTKFEVYIDLDDDEDPKLLNSNSIDHCNIYNTENSDKIIVKNMKIIIKNTSEDTDLRLYSIFPGDSDIPLLLTDYSYYNDRIGNYERVPMIVEGSGAAQTLNQIIYFRSNIPLTNQSIYYNLQADRKDELVTLLSYNDNILKNGMYYNILNSDGSQKWTDNYYSPLTKVVDPEEYIDEENSQLLWGYRKRDNADIDKVVDYWKFLSKKSMQVSSKYEADFDNYNEQFNECPIEYYLYNYNHEDFNNNNTFLLKYGDITGLNKDGVKVTLSTSNSLLNFLNTVSAKNSSSKASINYFQNIYDFEGGFLYPKILSKSSILIDSSKDYKTISAGQQVSIPIVFEYFICNGTTDGEQYASTTPYIRKTISFDIRYSLLKDPLNYTVEITGYNQYTSDTEVTMSIGDMLKDLASTGNNVTV